MPFWPKMGTRTEFSNTKKAPNLNHSTTEKEASVCCGEEGEEQPSTQKSQGSRHCAQQCVLQAGWEQGSLSCISFAASFQVPLPCSRHLSPSFPSGRAPLFALQQMCHAPTFLAAVPTARVLCCSRARMVSLH